MKKINSEEIKDWSILDLPRKYSLKDYQESRKEIRDKVGKVPGVVSILEWGTVHHPGIADMDFFIVFDEQAKSMDVPDSINLSEKTLYLMMHRFLVISEKIWPDLLYFVPWTAKKYPDGIPSIFSKKELGKPNPLSLTKREKWLLDLTCLYERNEQVFSLIKNLVEKTLPVRHLFEVLKIADRCILQLNKFFGVQIKTDFCQRFKELEDNWFEAKQEDGILEMTKLLEEGLRSSFKVAFAINDLIKKEMIIKSCEDLKVKKNRRVFLDSKINNIYFSSLGYNRLFTEANIDANQAFEYSLKMSKGYKLPLRKKKVFIPIVVQPLFASFYLMAIIEGNGMGSERFKKDCYCSGREIPILKSEALARRVALLNKTVGIYSQKQGERTHGKGYIYGANFPRYDYGNENFKRKLMLWFLKTKYFFQIKKVK